MGILLVGGAFLFGLYALRPPSSPRLPVGLLAGVPKGPLRVVSLNVADRSVDDVLARLKSLSPDVILLQHVEARNVPAIVGGMDMSAGHHSANYQPTQTTAGKKSPFGTLVMSRFKLYEAHPLRSHSATFGVRAACAVADRHFLIVSVDFASHPATQSAEKEVLGEALRLRPHLVGSTNLIEPSPEWQVDELRNDDGAIMVVSAKRAQ